MPTTYGLPDEAISQLRGVFNQYPAIHRVLLYGSRAKGNYRPGSDIDLSIQAPTLGLADLLAIENRIDELLLPWTVDLSLLHHIDNPELIDHIRRIGIPLYAPAATSPAESSITHTAEAMHHSPPAPMTTPAITTPLRTGCMSSSQAQFMAYRPDIQGLRAVAVLVVMLFHFNSAWLPGGFVGVDVFLVISGYLIVSVLLGRKALPDYRLANTLRFFYVSRLKRIAPAYFAMLVLVSLFAAVLFLPQDLAVYNKGFNQAAWFNSNHYFAGFGDYFAPATHEQPLLHTWSLAVEMQFYLLAPFLVLMLPVRALQWLLGALLIGLTAVAEYRLRILGIQQETYFSLYARLPAFFAGALVALWMRTAGGGGRPWFGSLGLALVLASAAVQPLLGPFPGALALLPVSGAALLLLSPAQGPAGQLLASKPMVWLGELWYSLYLWHWPVLALLRYYTGSPVLDMPFSLLFGVLTLLMATLSYHAVETPLRARHTRLKQVLAYCLLAGTALATGPAMASINQALSPPPLPIEYQRYADATTICHGQMVGDCLKGDLNSDKEVLVLGDSHAAMLNLFFDRLGKELGFKARIITASSCVTIPGFDYQRIPEWAHKPCLAQIEQAKKYLPNAEVIFLASMWNWQLASSDFHYALEAFLSEQSRHGVRVYLMEQVPMLRKSPQRAVRMKAIGIAAPRVDIDPTYQQANAHLQRLTSIHPSISSLNFETSGLFTHAPISGDVFIYMDHHHLNEEGAKRYATAARSKFQKILKDIRHAASNIRTTSF